MDSSKSTYTRVAARSRRSFYSSLVFYFWLLTLVLSCSYLIFIIGWSLFGAIDGPVGRAPGTAFGWRGAFTTEVTDPEVRDLKIVACAKVTGENPYLLEWIEFHRLQGVEKFVLYHDSIPSEPVTVASSLELEWLPSIYRDAARLQWEKQYSSKYNKTNVMKKRISEKDLRNAEGLVEVQSASLLIPDGWQSLMDLAHNTLISHRLLQPVLFADCLERYKHRSNYILDIDVDEFVYSPKYDSIWDFLVTEMSKSSWINYLLGRIVGIHIRSINFGSSGQFWDFHNSWTPDYQSGTIQPYFDIRDSTLLRYIQSLDKSIPITISNLTRGLDHFRLERNDLASSSLPAEVNEFYQYVKLRLSHDYTQKQLELDRALTDEVTLPPIIDDRHGLDADDPLLDLMDFMMMTFKKLNTFQKSSHVLTQPRLLLSLQDDDFDATNDDDDDDSRNESLIPPASAKVGDARSQLKDSFAFDDNNNETQGYPLITENNLSELPSPQLLNRIGLYKKELQKWNLFNPLIIEEQIRRGPHTSLDYRNKGSRIASEVLPICRLPSIKRAEHLIKNDNYTKDSRQLKTTLDVLKYVCKGQLPPSVTAYGKNLYFTSALQRSNRSRKSGRLRGCYRPGVHDCSHYIFGGRFSYADPTTELRLDHHQFRSFQKRSFGLPRWRGGPLGYSTRFNFKMLDSYLNSIVDTSKLKFIPRLRQRLVELHSLPRLPDYEFKLLGDTALILSHNVTRHCTKIEMLGEHEIMCPSKFPYVGFVMSGLPPPHPYSPYSWCSLIESGANDMWTSPIQLSRDINYTTHGDAVRDQTQLCSAYGETRCCDYNQNLLTYQSEEPFGNPKVSKYSVHRFESILYLDV